MKKLILVIPLLISFGALSAMKKFEHISPDATDGSKSNEAQAESEIIRALSTGKINDVERKLSQGFATNHIFKSENYKGDTLLKINFRANAGGNRYEMAQMLLALGAKQEDLNEFLVPAVQAANFEMVDWLVAHGASDKGDAYDQAVALEATEKIGPRKERFGKIKNLLSGRKSLISPVMKRSVQKPPAAAGLPVIISESKRSAGKLPVIKRGPPPPRPKNGPPPLPESYIKK